MTTGDTPETAPRVTMDEITALAKRRGFIFQSSEIYGGIGGFFDYGPLGAGGMRAIALVECGLSR